MAYLLLIAIYFFFVNIEARNTKNKYQDNNINTIVEDANFDDTSQRISIPVIPFEE